MEKYDALRKNRWLRWMKGIRFLQGVGWIGILVLAGGWGFPKKAESAPCCMSAALVGMSRLRTWEKASLTLRSSVLAGVGAWDTQGEWQAFSKGVSEEEWRTEIEALFRLSPLSFVSFRVPWSVGFRQVSQRSEVGAGLGDLQIGFRYDLLSPWIEPKQPTFGLVFGIAAPAGRKAENAILPLGSDVTTRGAWLVSGGLSAEKGWGRWFVRGDLGVQVPLPQWREDLQAFQRFGIGVQGVSVVGFEAIDGLMISLYLRGLWESDRWLRERIVEHSSRVDLGLGLSVAWDLHEHWSLQGSIDTGFFASSLGVNQPGRVTVALGVRCGLF